MWPQDAGWLDDVAKTRRVAAYFRRKSLEADLMLSAVARALGSGESGGNGMTDRISAPEMLANFGVII